MDYADIILFNSRRQVRLVLLSLSGVGLGVGTQTFRVDPQSTLRLSLPPCAAFRALKEAFLHQLLRGSRQYDLQLRNDLLVITTLIAQIPKSPLIVRSESLLSCHTSTSAYLLKA